MVLAVVGGRLLGVRLPVRRALLVAFPGLVAGYVFAYLVARHSPGQLTPLVVVAAVMATMLLTVLAELVARPGARPRRAGVPRPWQAVRQRGRRIRRYGQLVRIAARHGLAGFFGPGPAELGAPGQLARRLRAALEEAGPIFVKLGQVLSTRTDLLPAAMTTELSRLQDRVSAVPWPAVQALLEEELGASVEEIFDEIEREPVAAASLAQAYRAQRHGGTPVILKVQRPGITDPQQDALRRLLTAIAQRDPAELYEAVTELAATTPRDEELLEQTLAAFMTRHLGPGMAADVAMIRDLMAMLADAGAAFPPVIGGVFRALIILDGTLRMLAPGFDMAVEAQAVARQLAGDQLTPDSLRAAAAGELLTLLPMLRKLPRRADRISAALAQGRLTTNLRLFSDPRDISVISTLVNRAVLAVLGSALGLMSVLLLQGRAGTPIAAGITALQLFGYIGLFLSVTLILRVVIDILHPRR